MKIKIICIFLVCLFIFALILPAGRPVSATEGENYACAVYFTGIGCPHCATADPVIFGEILPANPSLVLIEYEIYQQSENAPLIYEYNSKYGSGLGIPLMIFNKEKSLVGGRAIIKDIQSALIQYPKNGCPLSDGIIANFNQLDISKLSGQPKIWRSDRILIAPSERGEPNNVLLQNLMTAKIEDLSVALKDIDYRIIEPEAVPLSGRSVKFERAIELGKSSEENGWIFQWNGANLEPAAVGTSFNDNETSGAIKIDSGALLKEKISRPSGSRSLNIFSIMSLAAVDAINPCALTVLLLMLISILTYNPKNKKRVLLSGLSFAAAVFILYFLYGLVIIRFFQVVQAMTFVRLWLYKILGVGAIVLGVLNIRDYLKYRPGRLGTEMPLFMRPKVKKILSGVTSPKGAFAVGAFVTLFLLPCTIGPYIICGGILCAMDLFKTIPWLLLYNLVFIIPMLIITGVVYGGIAKVEDISGWKDKNIRRLHLVAGVIILALGVAMILGWV